MEKSFNSVLKEDDNFKIYSIEDISDLQIALKEFDPKFLIFDSMTMDLQDMEVLRNQNLFSKCIYLGKSTEEFLKIVSLPINPVDFIELLRRDTSLFQTPH